MYYSIRHLTKFLYSKSVSESMMETRMHPRSDQNQRCLTFHLSVSPRCRVFSYRDHLANQVHHFDIPGAAWATGHRGGVAGRGATRIP
jgi:transglutaminase-like putative cysteine protease